MLEINNAILGFEKITKYKISVFFSNVIDFYRVVQGEKDKKKKK